MFLSHKLVNLHPSIFQFQKNKEIRIGRAPHVTFCPGLRTSALRSLTRKTFASPERAEDLPTYFDMYPDVNGKADRDPLLLAFISAYTCAVTTEEAIMNWWERNLTFSQNETFLLHESRGMSLESLQVSLVRRHAPGPPKSLSPHPDAIFVNSSRRVLRGREGLELHGHLRLCPQHDGQDLRLYVRLQEERSPRPERKLLGKFQPLFLNRWRQSQFSGS